MKSDTVRQSRSVASYLAQFCLGSLSLLLLIAPFFFIYHMWTGTWHPILLVLQKPMFGSANIFDSYIVSWDNVLFSVLYLVAFLVLRSYFERFSKTLMLYVNAGGRAAYYAKRKAEDDAANTKEAERVALAEQAQMRRNALYTEYPGWTDREIALSSLRELGAIRKLLEQHWGVASE